MRTFQLLSLALLSSPVAAQTSATIYQDGRVVVRRTLPGAVPAGRSTRPIEIPDADLGTVFAIDSSVRITSIAQSTDAPEESLLRRALGKAILVRTPGGDTVTVRVLSADPFRFEFPSGHVGVGRVSGQPLFRADDVGGFGTVATLESSRALPGLRLGYQTDGASWQANYSLRMGPAGSTISGTAEITNTVLDLEDVVLSVLAGQVGRARTRGRPGPRDEYAALSAMIVRGQSATAPNASNAPVGGYRIYSLPGRHRLRPGENLTIPLFHAVSADIQRVFSVTVADQMPPQGPAEGFAVPVSIVYQSARARGSEFGDQPLPPGIVAIYDGAPGQEVLVGEGSIPHTAIGERIVIGAGLSTEVTARRRPGQVAAIQDSVLNANGSVSLRTSAQLQPMEWVFTNNGDSPATIELNDKRPSFRIRLLESSASMEVVEGNTVRGQVAVPAGGTVTVRYRIRMDR